MRLTIASTALFLASACGASTQSQSPPAAPTAGGAEVPPIASNPGVATTDAQPTASNPDAPVEDDGPPQGRPECLRPEAFGPAVVPAAIYAARTGAAAAKFSELATSPERPLEECGLEAVLKRLASLTCNDGKNPFNGNLRAAHASRLGNIGPGGRCGSILDHYQARCVEKTYDVHADMYFCTDAPS
jgi:hypothetical protein